MGHVCRSTKQFLKKTAAITAYTGILLVVGLADVQAITCSISPADGTATAGVPFTFTANIQNAKGKKTYSWDFSDGNGVPVSSADNREDVTYPAAGGPFLVSLDVTDKKGSANCTTTVTVEGGGGGNQPPVLDPIGDKSVILGGNLSFTVTASDDGQPNGTLTISATNLPAGASFTDNGNGTADFEWLNASPVGSTNTTFTASDSALNDSEQISITVFDTPPPPDFADQTDFKIMMNYELGMHCTGFEFAYCCVLPAYNSILAQVVKPNTIDPDHSGDYARLMAGDPNEGLDGLGRETVVRDLELDNSGNFKKYVLKYWHDAQPRNDGRGKAQTSTLISAAEGNSLLAWNTVFDSAEVVNGAMQYGDYNGSQAVLQR